MVVCQSLRRPELVTRGEAKEEVCGLQRHGPREALIEVLGDVQEARVRGPGDNGLVDL